jgi:uncharacterized protein
MKDSATMRVMFDLTHPAHVHRFKNVIRLLEARGHSVLVTTRRKDVTTDLLDALNIPYHCLSRQSTGLVRMAWELMSRNLQVLRLSRKFRPDAFVGCAGVSVALAAGLLRIPVLIHEDTEHARLQHMLGRPMATRIFSGTHYETDLGARHVRYRGLASLMYLDPRYFHADAEPLRRAGVSPEDRLILLRLVSWQAAHDRGVSGAGQADIRSAVERLSRFGRVLISSEAPLPDALKSYTNPVPTAHMLDLMAHTALYIGEGATMAGEAAALGIPAVYCNPLHIGCLTWLEKTYGSVCCTPTLSQGMATAEAWLQRPNLKDEWEAKRRRLLEDSEDVNEFVYRLIEKTVAERKGPRVPVA